MFDIEGREGKVPFNVPAAGKPCETWYIVFGDLKSGVRPLVCLHGGPGACHNYISSLSALTPRYGIPVVLYDQIGNGLSTHLQEKNGDTTFWKEDLFIDELENLLARLGIQDDYDLLGQSWGGMMGSRFAARQPKGLNKLIIADSPADMHEWVKVQNELRRTLPQETQDLMKKHEVADTVESEEYENASMEFYSRFFCRLDPMPDECVATMEWLVKKDPTVYLTVNGPSEFFVTGPLKDWSMVGEGHKIKVPTLLINSRYDEAQDSCVAPFFNEIPKVKWVQFAESSHTPHVEEKDRYMKVVSDFLLFSK